MLAQLEERHPGEIRLVVRPFPLLSIHDKASLAAQAAEAAGAQGKYWEMHDFLFERYSEWVDLSPDAFLDWIIPSAADLDLDADLFETDMREGRYEPIVQQAYRRNLASGLTGTPFLFINGQWFRYEASLRNLEAITRLEVLQRRQLPGFPLMDFEPDAVYLAHLQLNTGEVVLRLYPQSAPQAVSSFIYLAEQGWFDGNEIYRVLPGAYVETGDPSGTGLGGPGYFFKLEIDSQLTFDKAGVVALSSSGPGTNGSRYIITLAPQERLTGSRTIFGQVIEGLDLLNALQARVPLDDILSPPEAVVRSVSIEKR